MPFCIGDVAPERGLDRLLPRERSCIRIAGWLTAHEARPPRSDEWISVPTVGTRVDAAHTMPYS
jgi:hypothetical protein